MQMCRRWFMGPRFAPFLFCPHPPRCHESLPCGLWAAPAVGVCVCVPHLFRGVLFVSLLARSVLARPQHFDG